MPEQAPPSPEDMSEDKLAEELMYWARVSRNEGGLAGKERQYLQSLMAEHYRRTEQIKK